MNRKGFEEFGIGTLIVVAVAIIVAVTLLTGGISGNVGTMTQKADVINKSYTFPVKAATFNFANAQAVSGVIVINATDGVVIPASNYTTANYVVSNAQLVAQLTGNETKMNGATVNVSYNYEPIGYDTSAGGRTIAVLIIIFSALAIAIVVLVPILKNSIFDY